MKKFVPQLIYGMKVHILLFFLLSSSLLHLSGQDQHSYSDEFLTSTFSLFHQADFELAYHMLPFVRKRFIKEIEDPQSFRNPYDSLSKYMRTLFSADSIIKTYSWDERNGGCCYCSATFAQFKTDSGSIKYVDLENHEESGTEIFISHLHSLKVNDEPTYLILGQGSCCGGKHYASARLFSIINEELVQMESAFDQEMDLFIGANRSQEFELRYDPKKKILSYWEHEFDGNTGFYTNNKTLVKWQLQADGFLKLN
ncbi:MAG: hypothetical protein AAF487_04210 [Bacteroidota bacterium]